MHSNLAYITFYILISNIMSTFPIDVEIDDSAAKMPQFIKVPTSIQAIEGSNVILSCYIENLNDRMVFWIRNFDLQILTAGLTTFSSDPRFRVNHENSIDEKDWSLLISNVKMEDQGLYECQINTEPKMKYNVNLYVKEVVEMMEMDSPFHHDQLRTTIEGKNLNVLERGQTITLTCKVSESDEKNSGDNFRRIDWMKNGELVNLETRSRGLSINTIWSGMDGISRLTLSMLQDSDEGNYSCTSSGYESDVVSIQIITAKGDESHNSANNDTNEMFKIFLALYFIYLLF